MASQLLDYGTTEIDSAAAAQCCALIKAVYAQDVGPIAPMLLPTGELVETSFQRETWPPSYLIVRSGPGDYVVAIEGTTSFFSQGVWHAWGTWLATGDLDGTGVNGQWQDVIGPLYTRIIALGDAGPQPSRWRVTGHSYGAACGQLIAERLRVERPTWFVQLMSIASPRARQDGYAGPRPQVEWRLNSYADGVPNLPYRGVYPSRSQASFPAGISAEFVPWTHYGEERAIDVAGDYGTSLTIPPYGESVSNSPLGSHKIGNYAGRLANRYDRLGGVPQYAQAIAVYRELAAEGDATTNAAGLPTFITLVNGVRVPNPDYYAPIARPLGSNRSNDMATPVVSTNVFQLTFLINQPNDDAGWAEDVFLAFGDTAPTNAEIYAAMNAWLTPRRAALNNQAIVVAARYRRLTPKGRSRLVEDPALIQIGPGALIQPRVNPAVVSVYNTYNDEGDVRGQLNMRGLNSAIGELQSAERRRGGDPGATERTFINAFLAAFVNRGSGGAFPRARALIEWTGLFDSGSDLFPILRYELDDNRLVVRITGLLPDTDVGSTVRLIHPKQRGITGLNGDTKVTNIFQNATPAGTTDYTLAMGFCGIPAVLPHAVGSIRPVVRRFVYLDFIQYSAQSTRDTGRPFGARVARQSKC